MSNIPLGLDQCPDINGRGRGVRTEIGEQEEGGKDGLQYPARIEQRQRGEVLKWESVTV